MAYLYTRNADGDLVHNRLNSVNDLGTAAGMPTGTSAYTYDRDGRLARDVRENLRLRWTVDNKLRGATNGNREVRYWYDATGQRVMKRLHGDTVEYIVRDGGGNELERVTRRNNTTSPILIKAEANLMGSGRLGIHELPATATADTMEQRASGRSQYELSDHLGNVRTTVGDVKAFTAINASSYRLDGVVRSANDHYPYGMPMNSRSFAAPNTYRFGFNTQEKSLELNSGGNFTTALFGEYDSRLARRWNLDPKPNPSISKFALFEGDPIKNNDILLDTIGFDFLGYDKNLKNAIKNIQDPQKNDGVFAIFAHGSPDGIQYKVNGKTLKALNPEALNSLLESESPEWASAMKEGKKVTLIFYSCNAGSNEYFDNKYTQKTIKTQKTIAEKMSEFLSEKNQNSLLLAGDGYGNFSQNENKFLGFRQSVSKDNLNSEKGGFIFFKNGQKIAKKHSPSPKN